MHGTIRKRVKDTRFGAAAARVRNRVASTANAAALKLFLVGEAWRAKATGSAEPGELPGDLKFAAVAHIYYPELLPEILACHAVLPAGAPLHLTAPPDIAERLGEHIRHRPDITLHVRENRGRDIAPFLFLLKSGTFDGYDAVLKLHTKRSPHLGHGDLLRRAILSTLAGDRKVVGRIARIMSDPTVGMVGWRHIFMTSRRHWHTNRRRVEALAASLNPPARADLAFFGGSMFWFRPKALQSLAKAAIDQMDFEDEAGQIDGTLHHAVERCFAIAAAAAGYAIRDTNGRRLLGPAGERP
jgi:lipopolysaccharide biosynthesis protein